MIVITGAAGGDVRRTDLAGGPGIVGGDLADDLAAPSSGRPRWGIAHRS